MKKMNFVCLAAGVVMLLATFLSYATVAGTSMKVKDFPGGAAKVMWVLALVVAVVGAINKRWFHIASLLCAAIVLLIAFKWQGDVKKLGGSVGIGGWLLLAGAIAGVVGSVIGLLPQKRTATAAI
jgi:uncharacterized membrane protein YhaH (DUF805 family)